MHLQSSFQTLAKAFVRKSIQKDTLQSILYNNITQGITSTFSRPLWFMHNENIEGKITSSMNLMKGDKMFKNISKPFYFPNTIKTVKHQKKQHNNFFTFSNTNKENQTMGFVRKKQIGVLPFSIEQKFFNSSFEILGTAQARFGSSNGKSFITVQITGTIVQEAESDFMNFVDRMMGVTAEKWQLYLTDLKIMSARAFWVLINFAKAVKKRGVRVEIVEINPFILELMRGHRVCRHFNFNQGKTHPSNDIKYFERTKYKRSIAMMKSIFALFFVVTVSVGLHTHYNVSASPDKKNIKLAAFSPKMSGTSVSAQQPLQQEQAAFLTEFGLGSKARRNSNGNNKENDGKMRPILKTHKTAN